jgi:hypothetical protein
LRSTLSGAPHSAAALFYQRLFAEGRLVWSRETGNVGVLNPSLRLYEIAPPASARLP